MGMFAGGRKNVRKPASSTRLIGNTEIPRTLANE